MGFHICEYCKAAGLDPETSTGDVWLKFTNGDFWVMPDMIVHYIEVHGWMPPEKFINDVLYARVVEGKYDLEISGKPIQVGYLNGKYRKGISPNQFVKELKKLIKRSTEDNNRNQSKSLGL